MRIGVMIAVGHNLKVEVEKNVLQMVGMVFELLIHEVEGYANGNHFNIIFIKYNNYYI